MSEGKVSIRIVEYAEEQWASMSDIIAALEDEQLDLPMLLKGLHKIARLGTDTTTLLDAGDGPLQ